MKIGFAITAYDKFEEAKIMFEIIRNEFKGDYKISFCSNHPEGKKFAKENNIDNYVAARDIPNFVGDQHYYESLSDKIRIRLRSTDSVQKSCLGSMNMDVDYIIHIHSDAWVLSENALIELVSELDSQQKAIAIRGARLEKFYPDTPVGHADDHFFVFNKEFCLRNKVFDFSPEMFFPERFTVHGILFLNILTKVGLDKIWYYSDTKRLLNYDSKVLGFRTVRPVSYDPSREFLHVNRGSFPGDYGKNIQAMYLKNKNFSNSTFLRSFIESYYVNEIQLVYDLLKIENKLNRKLKIRFYSKEVIINREITYKQKLIKESNIKIILKNFIKTPIKAIYNKIRKKQIIISYDAFVLENMGYTDQLYTKWAKNMYFDETKQEVKNENLIDS